MNCKKCGNPLRIIKGGNKTTEGTTQITTVHVWGCLNPECELKMIEQNRTTNTIESFEG